MKKKLSFNAIKKFNFSLNVIIFIERINDFAQI